MVEKIAVEKYQKSVKSFGIRIPEIHVVLGSGYAPALGMARLSADWKFVGDLPFSDVPELHGSTVVGHQSSYRFYQHEPTGRSITLQMGRLHGYEGLAPKQVVQSVMIPKIAGTKKFILTNAAGSLVRDLPVGSVVLIKDHVNFTGLNPLSGVNPLFDGMPVGPRFPDLSRLYDPAMRSRMAKTFKEKKIIANEGNYLGVLGPSFETPAEVKLFAQWGMHAVGMSTVWEAIALGYAGAQVAGVSLLSNLACGLSDQPLSHEDVIRISAGAAQGILEGLFLFMQEELKLHGTGQS